MTRLEHKCELLFTLRYALFKMIVRRRKIPLHPTRWCSDVHQQAAGPREQPISYSYCERDRRAIFSRRVSKSCSHCWLFHLCKLLLVSPQDGWFVLCGWCWSPGGSLFLFTAACHILLSEAFLLRLYIHKIRDELTCSYYLMCFFRGWHNL